MGAFPLDVRACSIDALAADGHKWMLGPEGCAILYISRELQDHVEPVEFGWTNVAGYNDYASRDMALRQDAGRYEPGTLNTIGCFGLCAAIELLLEVGVGEIAPVVQNLADRIAAGVQARGYEIMGDRTPETGAGIVSFRKEGRGRAGDRPPTCATAGISAAPRAGWVRTSPHFYISPAEIDRFLQRFSRFLDVKSVIFGSFCWFRRRFCAERAASRPSSIALRKRLHVNPLITRARHARFRVGRRILDRRQLLFPDDDSFYPARAARLLGADGVQRQLRFPEQRRHGDPFRRSHDVRRHLRRQGRRETGHRVRADGVTAAARRYGRAAGRHGDRTVRRGTEQHGGHGWRGRSATHPSDTNPGGTLDLGAGYGYRLRPSGRAGASDGAHELALGKVERRRSGRSRSSKASSTRSPSRWQSIFRRSI